MQARRRRSVRSFETVETRRLPKASIACTRGPRHTGQKGAPLTADTYHNHSHSLCAAPRSVTSSQSGRSRAGFLSRLDGRVRWLVRVFVRVLSRHPSSHSRAPALGVWAARFSAAKVRSRRRLQDSQLLLRWVSISHTSLTLEPTVVIGLKRPAAYGQLHPFCSSKPILCTGQNWLPPAAPLSSRCSVIRWMVISRCGSRRTASRTGTTLVTQFSAKPPASHFGGVPCRGT